MKEGEWPWINFIINKEERDLFKIPSQSLFSHENLQWRVCESYHGKNAFGKQQSNGYASNLVVF